ncbi:MAG: DUF6502 family protein [Gammaproteobacteria bacterium]|nr:DUF6502 family protein [Gammaproteobacteria bacterium]
MQDEIQKQILDAFFVVLRPIAKILLRYGIGFREFAEVAKSAFVDVATSEYGIRGRPTNISRVAVMTGLTRKEVRRLRDQLADGSKNFTVMSTPLAKVLHKWHSEDEFLDTSGRPAILPFTGECGSFSALVKKFGGDIPPGAMRTELARVGAIEEKEDCRIEAIKRSIRPNAPYQTLCVALSHAVYAHLCNVAHNTNPNRDDDEWAQRTAWTTEIRASDVPRIRRICNDRIEAASESFDDLFMAYEKIEDGDEHKEALRPVAVSICYFEEVDEKFTSLWKT